MAAAVLIVFSFCLLVCAVFHLMFHSPGLFGEGPADRRERLRILLLDLGGLV